jgi:ferric-dicitrate binding protein FerR (iron transport regulator)
MMPKSDDHNLRKEIRKYLQEDNCPPMPAEVSNAILQTILESEEHRPVRRMTIARFWWAAAVILLAIGIFWWTRKADLPGTQKQVAKQMDVPPGKTGAILTLGDGTQVSLDTVKNATVAQEGGVTAKVTAGALVYDGAVKENEVVYNTMSTPKGRTYQMTLPDGTEVHLNAASSIRFPTAFLGKERTVEVTGEVFMNVAKNSKQPFHVKVNGKENIDVLGTQFNVNAYSDEESIKTTLLEGSVRMSSVNDNTTSGNDKSIILKPGQQAQSKGNSFQLNNNVDIDEVVAWKNGYFHFDKADLRYVTRQLARWYDIEAVYKGDASTFSGVIPRNFSLSQLLQFLKLSGIDGHLENGKLVIQQ